MGNLFFKSGPITFLKLREMGCDLHSAVNFCGKNVCRYDSSRQVDGPPNFRKLKVKKDPDAPPAINVQLLFIKIT
jgi:hypothetical protein